MLKVFRKRVTFWPKVELSMQCVIFLLQCSHSLSAAEREHGGGGRNRTDVRETESRG